MSTDTTQDLEWRLLYAKLTALLESAGENNAFGNGDYWLVDDNWGTKQHKLCVFRIESISRTLIDEIQKILKPFGRQWEVLVALDLTDKRYTGGPGGLVVTAQGIREDWNRQLLKEQLGYDYLA